MSQGVFRRAVKGGLWVFALSITQQAIALARLVILAHLLSPGDFGLMTMAVLALAAFETLTETGFEKALIQRKEDTGAYLNSAWTAGLIRGICLLSVLNISAPYVSQFFKAPALEMFIRAIGFAAIFRAFTNIGVMYFQKELEFNKQFVFVFSGRVVDFVVAVVAASILRNAWGLMLAFLSGDAVRMVLSYVIHPYRPRLELRAQRLKDLFKFGRWILGSGILVFLLTQGDNATVAKVIGASMLGLYQLAYRISNMPATEIAHVIYGLALPAYSKLQDSMDKLREGFMKVLQLTTFFSLPIAGMILVLAPEITRILFGEKWVLAAPAMQILAVWGALGSIVSTAEPVLVAVGRPVMLTKYQSVQVLTLATIIYPLTQHWGIRGTALAVVAAAIVPYLLVIRKAVEITASGAANFHRTIAFPLGAAAIAAGSVGMLKHYVLGPRLSSLGLGTAIGAFCLIYLLVILLADGRWGYRILPLARDILAALRSK